MLKIESDDLAPQGWKATWDRYGPFFFHLFLFLRSGILFEAATHIDRPNHRKLHRLSLERDRPSHHSSNCFRLSSNHQDPPRRDFLPFLPSILEPPCLGRRQIDPLHREVHPECRSSTRQLIPRSCQSFVVLDNRPQTQLVVVVVSCLLVD